MIRGIVVDLDFQPPIPLEGVTVTVVELGLAATTGQDGSFLFDAVPPGSYSLSFAKDGYERSFASGVVVTPGQLTDVRGELAQAVIDMPALIVSGADLLGGGELALLEIRQESITLQDSISSDLISKAGATDAGDALKLVVGASVVEGKYATVRGLSDRYTGTTLNGLRVPSADPRRRAVQIDLFPTATIENVVVTKTFTPDLQGEFTGGGVDIETKSAPVAPMLNVSFGIEANSIATQSPDFLTYEGGGVFETEYRSLPAIAQTKLPSVPNPNPSGPTPQTLAASQQYDELTRSFAPVMGVESPPEGDGPVPGQKFSIIGGNRWDTGDEGYVGLIGAYLFNHDFGLYLDGQNRQGGVSDPGAGLTTVPRSDSLGTESLTQSWLVGVEWQINPRNQLHWDLLYNSSIVDTARFQSQPATRTQVIQNQALYYIERNLGAFQMHGVHDLPRKWTVSWDAAYNETEQDEPDVRYFRNVYDAVSRTSSFNIPGGVTAQDVTRRIFRNGQETNFQAKLEVNRPFQPWLQLDGDVRFGVNWDSTDREFVQDSFTYVFPNQLGPFFGNEQVSRNKALPTYISPYDGDLWTNVFADPDRIGLSPGRCTPPTTPFTFGGNCAAGDQLLYTLTRVGQDVDYTGTAQVDAAFALVELPIVRSLDLVAGVRFERTDIQIIPSTTQPCQTLDAPNCIQLIEENPPGSGNFARVEATPDEATADIQEDDWLPSLGLNWEIIPNMKLRASASHTLARPTFRELAPNVTEEFIAGDQFVGNPFLVLSDIRNYDLRWEWFRRPGEVLAASVFYKEITNPIEYIAFGVGGETTVVQPINFPSGTVQGFELEARYGFGAWTEALEGLAIGANYSRLDSAVDIPIDQQEALAAFGLESETRPLSGQPAFLLNLNLTYDNEKTGTSFGIFYNLIGDTLLTGAAVGADTGGQPDVYERQNGLLNVTFSQRLGKGWTLALKAKNLDMQGLETFWSYTPEGATSPEETLRTYRDRAREVSLLFRWEL
ncbi:MAG: TonB-dependent receptor [Acidobacteriota bacterium]